MNSTVETLQHAQSVGVDFSKILIEKLWKIQGTLHAEFARCNASAARSLRLNAKSISNTALTELLEHPELFCPRCLDDMVAAKGLLSGWAGRIKRAISVLEAFDVKPGTLAEYDERDRQLHKLECSLPDYEPVRNWFYTELKKKSVPERWEAVRADYLEEFLMQVFPQLELNAQGEPPRSETSQPTEVRVESQEAHRDVILMRIPGDFTLMFAGLTPLNLRTFKKAFERSEFYLEVPGALGPWVKRYIPSTEVAFSKEPISEAALEAVSVLDLRSGFMRLSETLKTAQLL